MSNCRRKGETKARERIEETAKGTGAKEKGGRKVRKLAEREAEKARKLVEKEEKAEKAKERSKRSQECAGAKRKAAESSTSERAY